MLMRALYIVSGTGTFEALFELTLESRCTLVVGGGVIIYKTLPNC